MLILVFNFMSYIRSLFLYKNHFRFRTWMKVAFRVVTALLDPRLVSLENGSYTSHMRW